MNGWLESFFGPFFHDIGGMAVFVRDVHRVFARHAKTAWPLIVEQIGFVATRSLSTVLFAGFFVGAILIIQFRMMLANYEAVSLIGGLNTSACFREIGPLIISFLLAGKIGAFTAAELGTMKVTEQVDAVRCLGTDPMRYLIVPRYMAIVFCSVVLLVFGLMVTLAGSVFISSYLYHINFLQYVSTIPRFTNPWTVFTALFKCFVYGSIVAAVSTYMGYTASHGAKGVGRAVTSSATYTMVLIVLLNAFCSYLLISVEAFVRGALGGIG